LLIFAFFLISFFIPYAKANDGFEIHELAQGVWVHSGTIGDFAPENQGDLSNLGFVIGERCVAVIDTGGSKRVGMALLNAIRSKTKLPVCFVIATHMHPDHLLGHAAFLPEHPQFVASATQARALNIRKAGYLARQKSTLGELLAEGTEVIVSDHPITATERLDLGGRELVIQSWRTAHTDNDLTIQDSLTHTLFTGDLLFVEHLPVVDGSIKGWLKILPDLMALAQISGQPVPVVPGHGPDSLQKGIQQFEAEHTYLLRVASEVRVALKAQQTLQQAVSSTTLPDGWKLTELYHRRNVTAAFAELEWED